MCIWAAVRVPPQKEAVVARRLVAMLGCVIYLPKARIVLPRSRRPVTAPLFRTYLFADVDQGPPWQAIRRQPGVISIVMTGDAPSRCPQAEIEKLKAAEVGGLVQLAGPPPPDLHPVSFRNLPSLASGRSGADGALFEAGQEEHVGRHVRTCTATTRLSSTTIQAVGDKAAESIHAAVGAALSAWEMAEEALASLCLLLSETKDQKALLAVKQIFGSIESSAGRRNALQRLYEVYFHPHEDAKGFKTPFDQLTQAFSAGSKLRDDIAHGVVVLVRRGSDDEFFLVPSGYNSGRNFPFKPATADEFPFNVMKGKYRYSSKEIDAFRTRFEALWHETIEYTMSVQKVDGKLPEAPC